MSETQQPSDMEIIEAMSKHGGGFVKALAQAAWRADSTNLSRIKEAFPDYWREYSAIARETKE
jgi:hypothetical protein